MRGKGIRVVKEKAIGCFRLFFFFFVLSLVMVLFFLFYYLLLLFFFNNVLTWKIVEASKASVLYIY